MKIFLIAGKAGSGKKEVAKYIKEFYIYQKQSTVITGYGKYLKLFAGEINSWDGNDDNKPRKFLQDLGSHIREDLKMPDFFVNRMLEDIKIYEKYAQVVVINDVRLPNEIEAIKAKYPDAISMYVINQFGKSNLTVEEQTHITETALENYDGFNYTLVNNDLKELRDEVFKILGA